MHAPEEFCEDLEFTVEAHIKSDSNVASNCSCAAAPISIPSRVDGGYTLTVKH